jgi:ferredoxin
MALVDSVARRAIQQWMDENHPLVVKNSCLNSKQRKFVCAECRAICPEGVYDSAEPFWDVCRNCNLCVAVCPSQAICPSSSVLRKFLQIPYSDRDVVVAACERSDVSADLQVDCLATIPWEMATRIALRKTLVLDTDPCASCSRTDAKAQISALLSRVEKFLGAESFGDKVQTGRMDDVVSEGVSRREAFFKLLRMFRTTVGTLLPDDDAERPAYSAVYKKMLVNHLLKMHDEGAVAEVTWETPIFSDACTGCPVCSKTCVHGALEIVEDSDDGSRYLRHYAAKCTHCGLCERLCPSQAITGWTTFRTEDPLGARETAITAPETCEPL